MKLKIGNLVRVKTKVELEVDGVSPTWDEPYVYSQGCLARIAEVRGKKTKTNYLLKFDTDTFLKNIRDSGNIFFDFLEYSDLKDCVSACEQIGYLDEELVLVRGSYEIE